MSGTIEPSHAGPETWRGYIGDVQESEDDDELLAYADRLVLEIAREHGGQVDLEIYREGVKDPDIEALWQHARDMCERGYLRLIAISGTKAHMQGARQAVLYRTTEAGERALQLADLLADPARPPERNARRRKRRP